MRRLACAAALLLAALGAGLPAGSAGAAAPALFGTAEFRADSLAPLPQWRRVLDATQREDATLRACARDPKACPSRGARAWLALLRGLEGAPRLQQIREVNRFVNGWAYRTDAENYGRSDYWATPLEFFRRSGDCEDYAIAKYQSLRRLGFAPEQLRLVVLQDVVRDLAHAVLAVYLDGEVHILDNLSEAVLGQDRIDHYVPYYSVNEQARWTHTALNALVITASPGPVEPARRPQP
jgi:predicted transglutaminase-like cysteine proteinase